MQIILIIDLQAWQPCGGAYRCMCRPANLVEAHADVYLSGPAETYGEQGKDMSRTTFPALKQVYNSRVGLLNNTGVRVYHMCRSTDIYIGFASQLSILGHVLQRSNAADLD